MIKDGYIDEVFANLLKEVEGGWKLLKERCRCSFCGYPLEFDEEGDKLFPHFKCRNSDCPESFCFKTGGNITRLLIDYGGMTLEDMTRGSWARQW